MSTLPDTDRWQVEEARGALAEWDRTHGGDGIYGTERVLADQVRNLLAVVDRLAASAGQEG